MQSNSAEAMTFDLLELTWWQNPWYFAAGLVVLVLFVVLGVVWYYKNRRIVTPEEKIIERLKALQVLPAETQAQQKLIYESLTRLIKEFAALAFQQPVSVLLGLTDHECITTFASVQMAEVMRKASQKIFENASAVKFAKQCVDPVEIHNQIMQLQQAFEQHVQENRKKA